MSNAKEKGMAYILMAIFTVSMSFATVTIKKVECPQQFEGRVEEIIESIDTGSAFDTHTVVFKNLLTLKGDVRDQVAIEMLENGPFEIVRGLDYRIQVKNGRLCWIEKI